MESPTNMNHQAHHHQNPQITKHSIQDLPKSIRTVHPSPSFSIFLEGPGVYTKQNAKIHNFETKLETQIVLPDGTVKELSPERAVLLYRYRCEEMKYSTVTTL
jgi:hypothetical protein